MPLWLAWWACSGDPEETLRSTPVAPTRDLSSPAVVVPADSPLAPFVSAGVPLWPTGMLGRMSPGLALDEVRSVAEAIRDPHRPPPERSPGVGVIAVSGQLVGFEHVAFVALVRDGRLVSLDVSARANLWDGVLADAWGPGVEGTLKNGLPTVTWVNPASGLVVTQTRSENGLTVVKWSVDGAS